MFYIILISYYLTQNNYLKHQLLHSYSAINKLNQKQVSLTFSAKYQINFKFIIKLRYEINEFELNKRKLVIVYHKERREKSTGYRDYSLTNLDRCNCFTQSIRGMYHMKQLKCNYVFFNFPGYKISSRTDNYCVLQP